MTPANLEKHLTKSALHQEILKNYPGSYALGVTSSGDGSGQLLLRVEADSIEQFAKSVNIEGEVIPIIVKPKFKQPKPLH